jgi:uncharacterized protein YkwD
MSWSRFVAVFSGAALVLTTVGATAALASNGILTTTEAAATAPAPSQPAGPMPSVDELEAQMLSMINAERAAVGVGPVQAVGWAHSVAQQHSRDMAAAGDIWHNIAGFINQGHAALGAVYLGENVAMDSTLAAGDALLYSDIPHRDVTLDARFNFVGIGIALDARNWVFLTEDFAQVPGGAAPAPRGVIAPPAPAQVAPMVRAAAVKVPVAVARVKPKVVASAPAPAPAPTAAPAPALAASQPAQAIVAKPISHTSPVKGGMWIMLGLAGLLIAAVSASRFLAVLGQQPRRRRTVAPVYSLNTSTGRRPEWQRAA